jgi:RNA polymerase sigma-70 factor (ECF subfamily)
MLKLDSDLVASSVPEIATLVSRAQQGDAEAFDAVCRTLESRLLRQAVLLCGDCSLAEDLTQETLGEAWKCINRYNGRCQFFTWLCAILHNRYRNVWRRRRISVFLFGDQEHRGTPNASEELPDEGDRPDQAVQLREQAELVRRCVQALPLKQQRVIYLRFFVDDSLDGIAAALRCSVGTVKSRLFHALEKLRRMSAINDQPEIVRHRIDVL